MGIEIGASGAFFAPKNSPLYRIAADQPAQGNGEKPPAQPAPDKGEDQEIPWYPYAPYNGWRLIINVIGVESFFNNPYSYKEKESSINQQILLPGIGVRYIHSPRIYLDANAKFTSFAATEDLPYVNFLAVDTQFKYLIWHSGGRGYSSLRLNLGLGPAMNRQIWGDAASQYDGVPPLLQTKWLFGGEFSAELEVNESWSFSIGAKELTNTKGQAIVGAFGYFKVYFPKNPNTPDPPYKPWSSHTYPIFSLPPPPPPSHGR
jgi:hypothetical protein